MPVSFIPVHQTLERIPKKVQIKILSAILNVHSSIYPDTSCDFMLSYMVVYIKTECFLRSHTCVGGEHPYSYYVSGKHTSTSEMHCEALPKASLAFSVKCVVYVLAPASDSPQSISWGHLVIHINNELKTKHQLCYLQWGTLPQPWYGYCILMNGPESFTNQLWNAAKLCHYTC